MSFYIVLKDSNYVSLNYNLNCDNYNMCKFKIENNFLIRCNDNKYLYLDDKNKLYFSEFLKTKIILENTNIKTNFKIKINEKYINYENKKIILKDCNTSNLESNLDKISEWIFIDDNIDINHDIVIARYNEDISWTRYLRGNVIIYNKGPNNIILDKKATNIKIIILDNIGREGHTYLHHIITNYDSLAKRTTFLQANPFEHSPDLLELLCMSENFNDIQSLSAWYIENIIPPKKFSDQYIKNLNGAKYAIYKIEDNLNIIDYNYDDGINILIKNYNIKYKTNSKILSHFIKRSNLNIAKDYYNFIFSALFSIVKKNINKNKIDDYINIQKELLSENKQGGMEGYILERLWYSIFEN